MKYHIIKRLFDILFSFMVIIFLLPIFVPIIIILLLTGEGEVFYMQKRVGRYDKKFKIYKFVTMVKNSSNIGDGIYTAEGDPRILPFGRFLRKAKINEMPQIFNIFLGSMSFVGPRPLIFDTYDFYNNDVKSSISKLRPGASGIGSIIFRNESEILKKSDVTISEFYRKNIAPYKGQLEVWYEKNISFFTDIKIIFLTVWVVVFPKSNLLFSLFNNLPEKPDYL
tara:strand:+ start:49616 stop:50287 length:672 start_codon:yes stop_codon:yes gene_type:complete